MGRRNGGVDDFHGGQNGDLRNIHAHDAGHIYGILYYADLSGAEIRIYVYGCVRDVEKLRVGLQVGQGTRDMCFSPAYGGLGWDGGIRRYGYVLSSVP